MYFFNETFRFTTMESVANDTLMGYQDGELKFMETHHENEFFDNEEKLRMIFRDYAEL